MSEPPVATIVVPVRNGGATLGRCLRALNTQTLGNLEVIVVDDGSTDDSAALARQLGAAILTQPCAGPAAARNRGAEVARSEILLFTDADCAPRADWAELMVRAFDDPSVAACKGTYESRQTSMVARFVQLDYNDRYRRMRKAHSIDFVDTYSAGYRRQVLRDLGGFDQSFRHSSVEDQELSFRAAQRGLNMAFVFEACVEHQHPETLAAYGRKKFKIGYYKPRVHRRHRRQALRDSHTPPVLRWQVLCAAVAIAALPSTPILRAARTAGAVCFLCILVSSLPFAVRNLRQDRTAGLMTPGLSLLRCTALALGLLAGSFHELWRLPGGEKEGILLTPYPSIGGDQSPCGSGVS